MLRDDEPWVWKLSDTILVDQERVPRQKSEQQQKCRAPSYFERYDNAVKAILCSRCSRRLLHAAKFLDIEMIELKPWG
jgi:hypothetical protein